MSKEKTREPYYECIAYLSTNGSIWDAERLEKKQERYIREYANAHHVNIVGVMHRNGFGQNDVNRQLGEIELLIRQKRVDGVILSSIMAVAADIPDAYYKTGRINAVGGVVITVDEGKLELLIKEER